MLFQAYQIYFQPDVGETTSPVGWQTNINTFVLEAKWLPGMKMMKLGQN